MSAILQENPQELELLFKELLIGVTSFFRDPAAWEQLKTEAFPALLAGTPAGGRCGPGCPAAPRARRPIPWPCVFKEALEQGEARPRTARCRSSPPTWTGTPSTGPARASIRPTSPPMCRPSACSRFFVKEEHGYRVSKEIREMVIFAAAEHRHGPALHQARHPELPQPADLPDAGAAEEARAALPLQPQSRRAFCSWAARRPSAPLPTSSRRSTASRGSTGGWTPPAAAEPVEFPASFCPAHAGHARASRGAKPAAQPPDPGGAIAPAALFPGGGAGQRQGRHPLHQRADRQVPGAGGRQGQLEHLRHGPRGAALRTGRRLPEGAARESARHPQEPEGRDQRRGSDRGCHASRPSTSPRRSGAW